MTALEKLLQEATERPWRATNERDDTVFVEAHHSPIDRGDGEAAIHTVVAELSYADFETDVAQSDARLIALAVNNLAACVELLERIAGTTCDHGYQEFCPRPQARALLARIEKEASV